MLRSDQLVRQRTIGPNRVTLETMDITSGDVQYAVMLITSVKVSITVGSQDGSRFFGFATAVQQQLREIKSVRQADSLLVFACDAPSGNTLWETSLTNVSDARPSRGASSASTHLTPSNVHDFKTFDAPNESSALCVRGRLTAPSQCTSARRSGWRSLRFRRGRCDGRQPRSSAPHRWPVEKRVETAPSQNDCNKFIQLLFSFAALIDAFVRRIPVPDASRFAASTKLACVGVVADGMAAVCLDSKTGRLAWGVPLACLPLAVDGNGFLWARRSTIHITENAQHIWSLRVSLAFCLCSLVYLL
jgi:hypothetical protein